MFLEKGIHPEFFCHVSLLCMAVCFFKGHRGEDVCLVRYRGHVISVVVTNPFNPPFVFFILGFRSLGYHFSF